MELTVAGIVSLVTLLFGQITKKLGLVDKKYIPYQNFVIGLLSGVICWLVELEPNIMVAILSCLIASYCAGGLYDNLTIRKETIEEEEE